jgi:hypothetical protein
MPFCIMSHFTDTDPPDLIKVRRIKIAKTVFSNFTNTSSLIRSSIEIIITHPHVDGIDLTISEIVERLLTTQNDRAQRWANFDLNLFETLHGRLRTTCHEFIAAPETRTDAQLQTIDRLLAAENAMAGSWKKQREELINNN